MSGPREDQVAARNPEAAPGELERLAGSPWGFVRTAVAMNPACPSTLLAQLLPQSAAAPEQELLLAIAMAPNADLPTLERVASLVTGRLGGGRDDRTFFEVGLALFSRAHTPFVLLDGLLADPRTSRLFRKIVARESRRTDVLERLRDDPWVRVRRAVERRLAFLDAGDEAADAGPAAGRPGHVTRRAILLRQAAPRQAPASDPTSLWERVQSALQTVASTAEVRDGCAVALAEALHHNELDDAWLTLRVHIARRHDAWLAEGTALTAEALLRQVAQWMGIEWDQATNGSGVDRMTRTTGRHTPGMDEPRFRRALDDLLPRYPTELPATFEDARGSDQWVIRNDGIDLTGTLRGVELVGRWLDDFEPVPPREADALPFALEDGSLSGGTLTVELPAAMLTKDGPRLGSLLAALALAKRASRLHLSLSIPGAGTINSCGQHLWFDEELGELVGALPPAVRLLDCYTCGLSDYSPVGGPLFGGLACFRGAKEAYRPIVGKRSLLDLWPRHPDWVQETHLCPDWEARPPGRGYRG